MKKPEHCYSGDMVISYKDPNSESPVVVNVKNIDSGDFMTFVHTGANAVGNPQKIVSTVISEQTPVNDVFFNPHAMITSDNIGLISLDDVVVGVKDDEEHTDLPMTDLNRNEIHALLKANKAEVDSVASRMQADMAKWRESMSSDMTDIKNMLSSQQDRINGRLDLQSAKIESSLEAHSKKIDAALAVQEAKLSSRLSEMKLDIIKWALGLPALAFAVYKIYGAISGNPTP